MRSLGVQPFGVLAPDQPSFGPRHMEVARNCLPRQWGYAPLKELQSFTDPLPFRAVGGQSFEDFADNAYILIGTTNGIYEGSGSGSWVDVSKAGGLVPTERWDFTAWEDRALMASIDNPLQQLMLGDANTTDLVATINAKTITTIRNQVVVGFVDDQDGLTPNRLRWSAVNNADDWTPSSTTLSGFAQLESSSGGGILRVVGGEFGIVFQDRSIWRATFTGDPASAFQLDEVENGIGILGAGSVVRYDGGAWYLAEDGFRVTRGGKSEPLGEELIDTTVLTDLDQTYAERITGTVLNDEQTVIWAYPGVGNSGGIPNKLILYNSGSNRWAQGEEAVHLLFQARRGFTSLEDLDAIFPGQPGPPEDQGVEDIPGSLDDPIWTGGSLQPGAIRADDRAALFSGPARTAVLETEETQHNPGRRTFVSEVRPVIEGDNVTVEVGHRQSQGGAVSYSPPRSPNADGICEFRVNNRYTRYRATVQAPWESAVGLEPFGEQTGGR